MNLYDSQRRRINDRPELLGRRVVVPHLSIFPGETSTTLSVMIPDDRVQAKFAARQVTREISDEDLPKILTAYRADPESTLETLFNISLAPVIEPRDRDLARDLARARAPTPASQLSRAERLLNAV